MTSPAPSIDLTAAPRALLRESVRLLYRVFGERRLRTARGNAWEAVCEDRERAADRDRAGQALATARTTTDRPRRRQLAAQR
jgi:hypothetical protein